MTRINDSVQQSDSTTSLNPSIVDLNLQVFSTFWFIGLEIKQNTESAIDLDLTEPIQDFTDRGLLYIFFNLIQIE